MSKAKEVTLGDAIEFIKDYNDWYKTYGPGAPQTDSGPGPNPPPPPPPPPPFG